MSTPFVWMDRRVDLSRRTLRWATTTALVMSVLIVVGGSVVRVTGSGLGCPEWPACTENSLSPTHEMGIHGIIEFANRLLTFVLCAAVGWAIVAARLQRDRQKNITKWGWIQFWVVVLNAVVGGMTVWAELSPYVVAGHFIAATLLLTAATITWDKARKVDSTTGTAAPDSDPVIMSQLLVFVTAVLIIIGTVVTGTGPHAGDSAEIHRIPLDWSIITVIHGTVAVLATVIGLVIWSSLRDGSNPAALKRSKMFVAVIAAQGVIGIVQSLTNLPELMVVLHVVGAALVWIGALRLLLDTRRPVHSTVTDTAGTDPAATHPRPTKHT
ncbi:COX15/CtaA family protein [Arthrobacter castelli]|uniref:COX15/CtaA family protein n=1 Tax=Arthrobacter castelli TaxID=271431 RepID=UPI000414BE21|nr:COX15/CtaA family protein [Arthrobacter castelli]